MRPNKTGQVANFNIRLPDENPNQHYVFLEIIEDDERPRSNIKALKTGLSFSPINTVKLSDLIVVEVDTAGLVGYKVTTNKPDYTQAKGKVVTLSVQKIILDFTNGFKSVETNVWLTIENGKAHHGTLFVN
jgi:hypothetical protein